ncbi:multisubunit sodium/proton antiporter, MrpG subunit [Peptoclostridium litorale DSM 5388]|uniref:Uncharacterized protein n=1 Tax=Peptoclostridium litorale DSM 5388 TaxID=1121324 RepID=A0A069RJ76_PEPLI|nr:monovalent cation/H(+) antiporter subunit G [Peptoclostridium litorale]KDR96180.1 hypothetical protein CLIT_4c00170 [Peptoclostridium litorale DSM 5388]SIO13060.1 multisubunit sodium/proton antiporter, MrpG subunit [Peptoclostridium litorale DSM 5388]
MISDFLLVMVCVYIAFGLLGTFRFKSIYSRLLTGSKIDTAAMITLLIALMLRATTWQFSLKIFLILVIMLVTTPISSHIIARSAFETGIDVEVKDPEDEYLKEEGHDE